MVQRHTAADCLRSPLSDTLPTRCQQLKKGYGECRRGMIDMRKRFRGNMPASMRQLGADGAGADGKTGGATAGGGGGTEGYQLYAGKAAFAGAAKETSGDEPAPRDWREVENEKFRAEQQKAAGKKT